MYYLSSQKLAPRCQQHSDQAIISSGTISTDTLVLVHRLYICGIFSIIQDSKYKKCPKMQDERIKNMIRAIKKCLVYWSWTILFYLYKISLQKHLIVTILSSIFINQMNGAFPSYKF